MLGKRHEIARLQSDFYRDQFRKMLRLLMTALVIIFLLVLACIYSFFSQRSNLYYANTIDGQVLPMPRYIVLSNTGSS